MQISQAYKLITTGNINLQERYIHNVIGLRLILQSFAAGATSIDLKVRMLSYMPTKTQAFKLLNESIGTGSSSRTGEPAGYIWASYTIDATCLTHLQKGLVFYL